MAVPTAVPVAQATAAFLVVVVITNSIMGLIGSSIGAKKDMAVAGFFFGFFLGPVGLIIIASLQPSQDQHDRAARRQGLRPCPHCREFIRPQATVCRFCGRDSVPVGDPVDEQALDREWESLYGS